MAFAFEDLPYTYDSLDPHIDAKTMEIHHTKHHRAYYDKFMAGINGDGALEPLKEMSLRDILGNISQYPVLIRNNAGGFYNHNFFWNCLTSPAAGGGKEPQGPLSEAITKEFGSYEGFKEAFTQTGLARFGSGFVWLIMTKEGNLQITSTANQDNPLMDTESIQGEPLMTLDVWEHAYYLRYQNRRPDYIHAFWNIIHWAAAEATYLILKG